MPKVKKAIAKGETIEDLFQRKFEETKREFKEFLIKVVPEIHAKVLAAGEEATMDLPYLFILGYIAGSEGWNSEELVRAIMELEPEDGKEETQT